MDRPTGISAGAVIDRVGSAQRIAVADGVIGASGAEVLTDVFIGMVVRVRRSTGIGLPLATPFTIGCTKYFGAVGDRPQVEEFHHAGVRRRRPKRRELVASGTTETLLRARDWRKPS